LSPILGIWASQISGHLWEPQGAYDALANVTLSGTASSITLAGIPNTYKHLQVRILARADRAVTLESTFIYLNTDSTQFPSNNYNGHGLIGNGSAASAYFDGGNFLPTGVISGSSATANMFAALVVDILDYTDTNKFTTSRSLGGVDLNGSGQVRLVSGLWRNTAAVNSVTFTTNGGGSFIAGTSFALYGIK
jgi:hypothetical protein